MGQAAGIAAALCVENGITPRNLDVALLQERMTCLGIDLFGDQPLRYPFNPSN